jgi:hypothetical protein
MRVCVSVLLGVKAASSVKGEGPTRRLTTKFVQHSIGLPRAEGRDCKVEPGCKTLTQTPLMPSA